MPPATPPSPLFRHFLFSLRRERYGCLIYHMLRLNNFLAGQRPPDQGFREWCRCAAIGSRLPEPHKQRPQPPRKSVQSGSSARRERNTRPKRSPSTRGFGFLEATTQSGRSDQIYPYYRFLRLPLPTNNAPNLPVNLFRVVRVLGAKGIQGRSVVPLREDLDSLKQRRNRAALTRFTHTAVFFDCPCPQTTPQISP